MTILNVFKDKIKEEIYLEFMEGKDSDKLLSHFCVYDEASTIVAFEYSKFVDHSLEEKNTQEKRYEGIL